MLGRIFLVEMNHGALAQSVEQLPFKQMVGGSNPPRPTRHSNYTHQQLILAVFLLPVITKKKMVY